MLSITKQPKPINFSNNPILLEIEADDIWKIQASGRNTHLHLSFNDLSKVVPNTRITFSWNDKYLGFLCVPYNTVANNDANEFEAYNDSKTVQTFYENLSLCLLSNWEIAQAFSIIATDMGLDIFLMGEPCENFLLMTDIEETNIVTIQTGIKPKPLEDYKILAQIIIPHNGFVKTLPVLEATPSDQYPYALFNLQEILDDYFQIEPPQYTTFTQLDRSFFSIRFTDTKEGKGRRINTTNTYQILRGGLDMHTYLSTDDFFDADYGGDIINSHKIFTNQPSVKTTLDGVPEYLYFFCFQSFYNTNIEITTVWRNGVKTTHALPIALSKNNLHVLPTSVQSLPPIANFSADIAEWSIQLFFTGNDMFGEPMKAYISTKQTYKIATIKPDEEDPSIFLFENSLGGFDTLVCTEAIQRMGKITQELSITEFTEWTAKGNVQIVRKNTIPTYKIGTGYLDTAHMRWIHKEFFASKHIWRVLPNGMKAKIVLKTDTLPTLPEREDVHRLEFEYQYAFQL